MPFWRTLLKLVFLAFVSGPVSCQPHSNGIHLAVFTQEEIFVLSDSDFFGPDCPRITVLDSDTLLVFVTEHRELHFWNLSTSRKVRVMDVSSKHHQNIYGFHVYDLNKVMLSTNPLFRFTDHASCVMLLDSLGRMTDSFSFAPLPVYNSGEGRRLKESMVHSSIKFPVYQDTVSGKALVGLMPFSSKYDSVRSELPLGPLAVVQPWSYGKEAYFLRTPSELDQLFKELPNYPFLYKLIIGYSIPEQRSVLIGTGVSSGIYRYDFGTDSVTLEGKLGSYLADDKIIRTPEWNSSEENDDKRYPRLLGFVYNSESELYFRMTRVGQGDSVTKYESANPIYTLSVYNKNFEKLGESALDFRASGTFLVPYKKGVLVQDYVASMNQRALILRYLEYSHAIPVTRDSFYAEIEAYRKSSSPLESENLAGYFGDSINTGCFLLVPLQSSCYSCLEELAEQMNEMCGDSAGNEGQPIHLYLISTQDRLTKEFLARLNPEVLQKFILHTDRNRTYLKYTGTWVNPRLVKVKNGEVVFDEIYDPDELERLYDLLRTTLGSG